MSEARLKLVFTKYLNLILFLFWKNMFSRLKNLIKLRSGKFPRDLDFCSCVVSFPNKEQPVFIRTTRPGLNIVEQDGAGEIKCF